MDKPTHYQDRRIFSRHYFKPAKSASLKSQAETFDVQLQDMSIDGVCFSVESERIDLFEPLVMSIEADLPTPVVIEMKLHLIDASHPEYHAMWNPLDEQMGITLLSWMKRLCGTEDDLYA